MSIDTHIQLRTPLSAQQVRAVLVNDPALTDLRIADYAEESQVAGSAICVIVQPWAGDDHRLIDDGFDTATVRCKTITGRGETGYVAGLRVIASILRAVPGDVCLANQDAAGPDLLRLGEVIYINPDGFVPEHLSEHGYTPKRLVIGIPKQPWWT